MPPPSGECRRHERGHCRPCTLLNANARPAHAGNLQIAGNLLTISPVSSFLGDLWILAGVTDDGGYTTPPGNRRFVYEFFKTTVTA